MLCGGMVSDISVFGNTVVKPSETPAQSDRVRECFHGVQCSQLRVLSHCIPVRRYPRIWISSAVRYP